MKNKYLKLDPLHPYYRVCLWPQCDNPPFMASRKDQDYCCKAHSDMDYNRYRRLKKPKNKEIYPDKLESEPEVVGSSPPTENLLPVTSGISEEKLNNNIDIFSRLLIDKQDGTIYDIFFLETLGIDLRHYSYRFPLRNIKNSFCILFGKYRTYLLSPTEILIFYKP